MTRTIRGLLWGTATLLAAVLFVFVFVTMHFVQERSIRKDAFADAEVLARVTFNSMFQLMSTGWTRAQLEGYVAGLDTAVAGSPVRITIFRGEPVSALFGAVEQAPADPTVRAALTSGTAVESFHGNSARFVFPLAAEERCLVCHRNAAVGTILGAIDVSQSVEAVISENRERMLLAYLPTIPVCFIAILLVVGHITRRLDGAIGALRQEINAVNRVSDLRRLATTDNSLGFAEFNRIGHGIRRMTERLREVAVDRELLEFEIRLLERFVITAEIVRDWREQVAHLLIEIDVVLPSRALVALFATDDGGYEVEVFWRRSAGAAAREAMASHLRAAFGPLPGQNAPSLPVRHTIADPGHPLCESDDGADFRHLRLLTLTAPRVGGIVAVGIHAYPTDEPSRLQAVEAVLSTLLNVVGSIKAINRYAGELEYHATRDPLTGLYNQRVFWDLLGAQVARSRRRGHPAGLLLIDLDNFKSINDGYGHAIGDTFLKTIAASLKQALRTEDILARYGGDEFVALLPDTSAEDTAHVARRILDNVGNTQIITEDGSTLASTVSIGIAMFPDHADDSHDLFLLADSMMYRAKSGGRNQVAVPSADDLAEQFRSAGEHTLRILRAVEQQRIEPFIQPILDTRTNRVVAVEVLCRLRSESGQLIGAHDFVPAAERLGIMHRIDLVVLRKAIEALAAEGFDGLIFVNTSPRSLVMDKVVEQMTAIVARTGTDPARVVFEITEREALHDTDRFDAFIAELRAPGFKLALDDFGSGFSSFQYLKRIPVDFLKIEGEFIVNMMTSPTDHSLVCSMVSLARELGIRCIAEHVETGAIFEQVASMGIDLAQGYHIGRPRPAGPDAANGLLPALAA
ncbi:MAG: bifunctional diguanylate cyclase/phosphodiesterase [Aromatoleum sp.]|uniref:putative bifunctional diguanylate cyclase/phosphodiesterase n=1 Tax=Aromatoleum sp. TaxID=2307007 RepID=UPI00289627BD|nr:bifunctional diguanylate cyclase/phosphodiesterase [Aromatoleum sp.]MDT3670084.1 bifunctional diguanylate cyclase/phosphodiesterase [Aromatoleum sp.]